MRWAVALLAACGSGAGTDGGPTGSDGGATAEAPAETSTPLSIERLDRLRFIIESDAITQLVVEHSAGRIVLERSGEVYAIKSIAEGSTAARLGLVAGDVIRGVNNVEMTGRDRLPRAWGRIRRDQAVKLLVERDGAVIEIEWMFARGVEDRIAAFRSPLGDRDRSTLEYAAVVDLARASLVETGLHRYKIDRAVLRALRDHPGLGDRRTANVWTARGAQRGVTVGVRSIYTALGLGRFDVVKGVGADDVRTATDLQRLIAARADTPDLSIAAVRLDEPVVLRYQLVNGTIDAAAWSAALEAWKKRDAESDRFGYLGRRPRAPRPPSIDVTGIKRITDLRYEIEPRHLRGFDFTSSRAVRVVPWLKNGKPGGLKLYAIRPSSTLAALGLKNGDAVYAINKIRVTGVASVRRAVKSLDKVRAFDVELTRRGRDATIHYAVKR